MQQARPSRFDLRKKVTKVRDQGRFRGTCVAHTAAACLEYELVRDGGKFGKFDRRLDLSEQYLYWACKQLDGAPGDEGSFLEYAMQALRDGVNARQMAAGVCRERDWRYNHSPIPNNESHDPPPQSAVQGSKFHISKAKRLNANSIAEIKRGLAGGHCVGLSVLTYHFWNDGYAWKEGRISLPLKIVPDGAHAVCLVAYQDEDNSHADGFFTFKNSWGAQWGVTRSDPGFGTLPYRYLLEEGIEAWTMEL